MTTATRYKVTIETTRHGADLAALFDMLRYEGARVVDWSRWNSDGSAGFRAGFILTIESDRHAPDRWLSFGLVALEA